MPHPRLARPRIADSDLLPAHDLGPTGLMNTNGEWHWNLLGNFNCKFNAAFQIVSLAAGFHGKNNIF
jgi:hypothetical protein